MRSRTRPSSSSRFGTGAKTVTPQRYYRALRTGPSHAGVEQLRVIMGRSAIHPGEHLVEQMEALDMSAAELARGRFGRPKVRKGVVLTSKNVLLSNFGAL